MKKNKLLGVVVIVLVLIESCTLFLMYKSLSNKKIEDIKVTKSEFKNKTYAIMIEQDDGTYKESESTKWPTEGYFYSETLSGCIDTNGNKIEGILTYDKATNIATVDTTTTSFCYLYFELKPICELALDSKVSALEYGAKYNCKVDPNKEKYTFYLIDNNEDETIDLIMSHNINALGEAVIPGLSSDLGMVLWYANNWDNSYGPTTAMTYLYNATKNWKNIEPLNFTYYDKEVQISDYGYESFISKNGIAKITSVNGTSVTIGSEAIPLRSRLPVYTAYSTNAEFNEIIDLKTNTFLNDNLDKERKNGPSGYWTISSRTFYSNMCWAVGTSTFVYDAVTSYDNYYGVRPVITVRL